MFFGFNVYDPRESPAVSAAQQSFSKGMGAWTGLAQKKTHSGAYGGKNMQMAMKSFDDSFKGQY
jgi:hypothetical protein